MNPPGVPRIVVHPLRDGTEVDPLVESGTVVQPPGDGTEVNLPGATRTVVYQLGDGTEVAPLGVTGTVFQLAGDGAEVASPVPRVAIRLPSARNAAVQQPLAVAGAFLALPPFPPLIT